MKEQVRQREETIAVLEQELAVLRTTADPPVSVATFAAEPIQFVTELEPLRVMSGFGQRFPEGRRRGAGRNLQAQWEADNPGHGRHGCGHNRQRDAPTAADLQCTAPATPQEPQHHELMADVDAQGYTLQDPLEADEPTGWAQFEEDIEELPPILDAPLNPNFAHTLEEEPTPAEQAYQSVGRTLRRRRYADIELAPDDVSQAHFVRASTTPHTTSEWFTAKARQAGRPRVPLIAHDEEPEELPAEATQSK